MTRYIKKSVVEAYQLIPDEMLVPGWFSEACSLGIIERDPRDQNGALVYTRTVQKVAGPYDWIVQDEEGFFEVCNDGEFRKTYALVAVQHGDAKCNSSR